jgi:UDP-N-acetylglucosamine 2-epimerase (non-hydrolysing)
LFAFSFQLLFMKTLACIVGARPNFVKMGPILAALKPYTRQVRPVLVHTGQHYDVAMSDLFFRQLRLQKPDVHLRVGSGRQGEQTAKILAAYEEWLLAAKPRPSATLVVGDVNSTIACALASVKLGIPVIHVEAGLRSFDRTMPEEINRVLTDAISDLLLVSEPAGLKNLAAEGRPKSAVKLVGNVMIDALRAHLPVAGRLQTPHQMGLTPKEFILWTMHRPSNVDDGRTLAGWIRAMQAIGERVPIVFPVHPRTRARLTANGTWLKLTNSKGITATGPLGYLECLSLSSQALAVVTDSGGLQEEATVLRVPCLTLRENTERPITVSQGTSTLVGQDAARLVRLVGQILDGEYKTGTVPRLWDGRAAERIAEAVANFLSDS